MPYITIPVKPQEYQVTFDDILNGVNDSVFNRRINTYDTRTVFRKTTPTSLIESFDLTRAIQTLCDFNNKYRDLIEVDDKSTLYNSFKIPKRSGGLRQIDAPSEELKTALRELKWIFEKRFYASYHTAAFAYIGRRSTIHALKRHQENKSRWFLKLDFSNFFGNSTPGFIISQLETIFPFNVILSTQQGKEELMKSLSICFLNNGLPQGSPISPMLTNVAMIPIDHYIAKTVREMTPHLVYTRYADDILLSCDLHFNRYNVEDKIIEILSKFNAPFSINKSKTRYGSSAGANWNLGLMLNKDNEITIGHKKKRQLKTMLFSFLSDYTCGAHWNLDEAQYLHGLLSYYRIVERTNIDNIVNYYNAKFNRNIDEILNILLSNAS